MFSLSSQKKYWMFSDESDLTVLREKTNAKFIKKHGSDMTLEQRGVHFLSNTEERTLLRFYELQLRDFCRRFTPPMPRVTVATALHYFKRFYLRNSVMDYHPKEILVTCVYLACKVEEFNISISQFVANIKGDREKASGIILNNELLLMQQLNYNLTIHNPFRPIEGLMIDIKVQFSKAMMCQVNFCTLVNVEYNFFLTLIEFQTRYTSLENPEKLRPYIDEFLERIFLTDSVLLYAPSQVALAATLHAASRASANLDNYVTDTLFSKEHLAGIIEAVRKIRSMAKCIESPLRETVKALEKKLDKCRNQENNPDGDIYKQKMQEMLDEEDLRDNEKYAKIIQDQAAHDEKILGVSKVLSPSTI